jgi:carbon storage regulator CsrA
MLHFTQIGVQKDCRPNHGEEYVGLPPPIYEGRVSMLVLTRKEGESILIGKDIRVIVVKIQGNQIRLGIEAPPHLSVVRESMLPVDKIFSREDSS